MAPAFFLMLREGLEAALIVGIIAAYLVRIGRRDALRGVWLGVGLAVALSVGAGILVVATVGRLPLVVQETLEGLAALIAVAVLTWMLFWMRRQGRALKGQLEHGVDVALGDGSTLALVGLAFVAVAREGLESMLFLLAIGSASSGAATTLLGALARPGGRGRDRLGDLRARRTGQPAGLLHGDRRRADLRGGRPVRLRGRARSPRPASS